MSSIYNNKNNKNIIYLYLIFFIIIIFISLITFLYNINYKNSIKHKIHKRPKYYELPKNIYCYWNNYEEDDFIKLFIENWKKKLNPDWKIIVIHKNNLNEYTHKKLDKYLHLDNTKFSDYLRLFLLKEYGGVWVDISTIIINNNFLDTYYNEMLNTKSDVLLYEYKDKTINSNYPYLENWFIIAPKKSILICDLYDLFEKSFDDGFINFKKNILMKSNMNLDNTIGYDNETIYLMMHACLNYLMYKGNKYKIIIKDASESMFKFQIESSWDNDKLKEKICDKNNYQSIYAIKLVGSQRNYLKNIQKENENNNCNINDIILNV